MLESLAELARPASVGALYIGSLSLLALWATFADDRVRGVAAANVRQLVATRFRGEVIQASLLVVAIAVLMGLILGGGAGWAVRLRDRLAGRPERRPHELVGSALAVLVVGHGLIWMADLAEHPQAYAGLLYAHGGVRALVQILISDWLGSRGVRLLGAVLALWWFGVPLARAVLARRTKPVLSAVGAGAGLGGLALVAFLPSSSRALPGRSARPNVLLIAADSLRADRVEPRVAPTLSKLAERGARFDRAYVSLPRTFPSWVSLLSGR